MFDIKVKMLLRTIIDIHFSGLA